MNIMSLFSPIEKLINEHGSAAIQATDPVNPLRQVKRAGWTARPWVSSLIERK
jgi:hypothetical protein